jgi:hypothetical protein
MNSQQSTSDSDQSQPPNDELPSDPDVEEIYVVLGEADTPQRAFTDKEAAEDLRDRWRNGSMSINARVESIELHRSGESSPNQPEDKDR